MRTIARNHGVGADAIALAAVLAQLWRPLVLSGAVEPLQGNLAASDVVLTADKIGRLTSTPESLTSYWQARSQRSWR